MTRRLIMTLAGVALGWGIAMSPVQAAPTSPNSLAAISSFGTSLAEKTHAWHRQCVRGPRGFRHRHVRGGVVACGPRARHRHCFMNRRGHRVCVWR